MRIKQFTKVFILFFLFILDIYEMLFWRLNEDDGSETNGWRGKKKIGSVLPHGIPFIPSTERKKKKHSTVAEITRMLSHLAVNSMLTGAGLTPVLFFLPLARSFREWANVYSRPADLHLFFSFRKRKCHLLPRPTVKGRKWRTWPTF